MRKAILLIALVLVLCVNLYAQEKKAAVGVGAEWNMNSRENFAGGTVLAFDYAVTPAFAIGLNATASSNFSGTTVIEPAALFRWYVMGGFTVFFLQADIGAFFFFDEGEKIPFLLGGIRGGLRIPFKSAFYVEPYGRLGYPFAFGIGVLVGIRFINYGKMSLNKEINFKR